MKNFSFSLETLLQEKNKIIEKTRKEMVPVVSCYNRAVAIEGKVIKQILGGIVPGHPDSGRVSSYYLQQLGDVHKYIKKEKKIAEEDLQKWQEVLSQKIKDRKILEVVKEKQFKEWKKKLNRQIERDNQEMILKFF